MSRDPLTGLDGEIRDHIARETADNIARGMAPADARHAALRKFGSVTLAVERTREVWIPVWLDQIRQDARYALRVLARHPGFTAAAALTLALGIGVTTGVFSVINAVLLHPLPYADAERIVLVRETLRGVGNASAGHFHDWTEHSTVFEQIAAGQNATFNLTADSDAERLRGMRVTPGYFRVAQLAPAIGRYFTDEDAAAGGRVAVLSHSLWQSRFGGDRSIVGRELRLNAQSFTVVGVAPAAYALTDPARAGVLGGFSSQLWTPLAFTPQERANFGNHYLSVLARLKPGVTLARAQEDLERVTRGIAERHPQEMEGRGVLVQSLQDELVGGGVRTQLYVLSGAVAFVLLIGCVNIASLIAARTATRQRELAIRASLGGGRSRIVRQLLTENLMLAAIGGLGSLLIAWLTIDFLVRNGPLTLPRLQDAGLQLEELAFAFAITGAAAILVGLAPALRAARADPQSSLQDGGRAGIGSGNRDRLRTSLVVAETAITVVLLIGTGLLLRSAERLRQVPLGFDAHAAITARLALPAARYESDEQVVEAYGRILAPLRGTSGIAYAGASTGIPLVGGTVDSSTIAEGSNIPRRAGPSPVIRLVTDDYFEAIGMTMAAGRSLQAADVAAGAPPVVVINERLAAALWPGGHAVGKRLWTLSAEPFWREVIGVVRDVRSSGQNVPAPIELFIPYMQTPPGTWDTFQRSMALVIRTSENWPETYVPAIRQAVRELDPSVPLYEIRTLENVFVAVTVTRRFYLRLVLIVAGAGLGLALLGVYGVIAYFVAQRTPEIGLRLAVGAAGYDVVRMVIGQALRVALVGLAIGLPAGLLFARTMRTLLFEVGPADPLTFVGVSVLLVAASLAAAAIPSLRAARIDPIVALRHE